MEFLFFTRSFFNRISQNFKASESQDKNEMVYRPAPLAENCPYAYENEVQKKKAFLKKIIKNWTVIVLDQALIVNVAPERYSWLIALNMAFISAYTQVSL